PISRMATPGDVGPELRARRYGGADQRAASRSLFFWGCLELSSCDASMARIDLLASSLRSDDLCTVGRRLARSVLPTHERHRNVTNSDWRFRGPFRRPEMASCNRASASLPP